MNKSQRGFNLLEMLTAVAVTTTTLTMAVPAAQNTLERRSISAAAEEIYSFTRLARTESIKRNKSVYVGFKVNANQSWCVGLAETPSCNCNTAGSCQLDGQDRVIRSADFSDVILSQTFTGNTTGFDARRGLAISSGLANLSTDNHEVEVQVSTLGHVKMCTPTGTTGVAGVAEC